MKRTLENGILSAFGSLVAFVVLFPLVGTFRLFSKLFQNVKNEKNKK